jgi:hypothetical protein
MHTDNTQDGAEPSLASAGSLFQCLDGRWVRPISDRLSVIPFDSGVDAGA